MPGRPLVTVLKENDAVGNTDTSYSVDLPKSNYIKAIYIRFRGTNGASMTEALMEAFVTRVKVECDGSGVIKYVDAQQARDIAMLRNHVRPDVCTVDNGTRGISIPLYFTRFEGDEWCLLPAMLFRTLRLELTLSGGQGAGSNTSFDAGTVKVDITVDELEAGADTPDQIKSKLILREVERESKSASSSQDFDLPLGNMLRGVLLEYTSPAAANLRDKWIVSLNNGAKIPYSNTWQQILSENYQQFGLVGYGLEGIMYGNGVAANQSDYSYSRAFIWLDEGNSLAHCIDTALYNEVHVKCDSLGASKAVTLTVLEVLRLA